MIKRCDVAALLTATGLFLLSAPCASQSSGARTYRNPVDIDYK